MILNVKLADGASLPSHAKPGDAGMDLTSRETVDILPGGTVMVGTGVYAEIPDGYYGCVVPRSGMASKRGITIANTPGTIDSSYRGEIKLPLHNINPTHLFVDHGDTSYVEPNYGGMVTVERGERVAQLIIVPYATCECVEVDELSETERGEGGFGSSGTH